jgi:methionine-rich copper-binding protein CopC
VIRAVLLAGLVALVAASPGAGHGLLQRAEPRAGSTVRMAPRTVRLWFAGAIEPRYSGVHVLDAAGTRVDLDDADVDPATGTVMTVSLLPSLPRGRYRVVWRALSVDSHVTRGEFAFRIAP